MKFTQEQVLKEVQEIFKRDLSPTSINSKVYDTWIEMAEGWLSEGSYDYLNEGFTGFFERTPNQILLDFHLNDKLLDPLSDTQVDTFLQ